MIPSCPETVVIENVRPLLDGGRYALKRSVGRGLVVEADIFKEGHDVVRAVLKWRVIGRERWEESPMRAIGEDRWRGECLFFENADHEYTIEAWGEVFLSWQEEFEKKFRAGVTDLATETEEGAILIRAAALRAGGEDANELRRFARRLEVADPAAAHGLIHERFLLGLMAHHSDRSRSTEYRPYMRVVVDRERAVFSAWYEFFPRSAEGCGDRGSTFRQCLERVDDARAMGFDVIYFPPIHPIGRTKRKGRNNSLESGPEDPGVPYAIGAEEGGHRAVESSLGTMEDFEWLLGEIRSRGMEVALDFAINCSPDHPYVREHPEWFHHRPDGTIKFAENPPKKYEDIFPLNFGAETWRALWEELRDVVLFWCARGVRIFRVDNPHTKPVAFWEWMIGEVRAAYPDAIFLSEAFTRPKMMRVLAKAGFTQSYTYFTWRNTVPELTEYMTELTRTEMGEYFRPHFFTNTPDILPFYLQQGGRPGFMIRAVLAATLSPLYGIYSGFELCENAPVPGREEYIDSEKYQFKARDWNAPGNLKGFLGRLNRVRASCRSMRDHKNIEFHPCENDQILVYSKVTPSRDDMLFIAVNLDPHTRHSAMVEVPLERFGLGAVGSYEVHDLLTDDRYQWRGRRNFVALDPHTRPAHVFKVRCGASVVG